MSLRAAILIISETASKDTSTDKGISALKKVFAEKGGDQWATPDTKIVTDNVLDIQRAITEWTDGPEYLNLVITSGGTGFAQQDVTPEVSLNRLTRSQILNHTGSNTTYTQTCLRPRAYHARHFAHNNAM